VWLTELLFFVHEYEKLNQQAILLTTHKFKTFFFVENCTKTTVVCPYKIPMIIVSKLFLLFFVFWVGALFGTLNTKSALTILVTSKSNFQTVTSLSYIIFDELRGAPNYRRLDEIPSFLNSNLLRYWNSVICPILPKAFYTANYCKIFSQWLIHKLIIRLVMYHLGHDL